MSRYYWVIAAICILAGCANSGSDNKILAQDQMTGVLWDMIQVDEFATLRLTRDTGKDVKKERIQLYQKVFQLHKISEKQFNKSFKYYSGRPDLFKVLFDTLEARGIRERKLTFLKKESLAK